MSTYYFIACRRSIVMVYTCTKLRPLPWQVKSVIHFCAFDKLWQKNKMIPIGLSLPLALFFVAVQNFLISSLLLRVFASPVPITNETRAGNSEINMWHMDRCTGCHDITEVLLKMTLNIIQSVGKILFFGKVLNWTFCHNPKFNLFYQMTNF